MLDPAVSLCLHIRFLVRPLEYRFSASTFPYRHVLFTESTCSLFRSVCFGSRSVMQLVFRILALDSSTSVLSLLSIDPRLPVLRLFDHSVPQIPACLCSQPLSCIQCIRISLMGMLGGFYVTLRASRCASTPAFWFSSCVRFRITSVLGNVCSQFKIHSRLCFGSMSCRGFQFFGFLCLGSLSSLLSRFFQSVFIQSSVFSLVQSQSQFQFLSLGSSISYSNSGSSL